MSTLDSPGAKRPATVTIVAIVVTIAAILQFVAVILSIFFWVQPGEAQLLAGAPVSDWYWVMTGTLSAALGLIYVWIAAGLLNGNPQAWLLINLFAVINIFFALFHLQFGTGWVEIGLNLILLVLNNTTGARVWFQTLGSMDAD